MAALTPRMTDIEPLHVRYFGLSNLGIMVTVKQIKHDTDITAINTILSFMTGSQA